MIGDRLVGHPWFVNSHVLWRIHWITVILRIWIWTRTDTMVWACISLPLCSILIIYLLVITNILTVRNSERNCIHVNERRKLGVFPCCKETEYRKGMQRTSLCILHCDMKTIEGVLIWNRSSETRDLTLCQVYASSIGKDNIDSWVKLFKDSTNVMKNNTDHNHRKYPPPRPISGHTMWLLRKWSEDIRLIPLKQFPELPTLECMAIWYFLISLQTIGPLWWWVTQFLSQFWHWQQYRYLWYIYFFKKYFCTVALNLDLETDDLLFCYFCQKVLL